MKFTKTQQQWLVDALRECARRAYADAGYTIVEFDEKTTGVL